MRPPLLTKYRFAEPSLAHEFLSKSIYLYSIQSIFVYIAQCVYFFSHFSYSNRYIVLIPLISLGGDTAQFGNHWCIPFPRNRTMSFINLISRQFSVEYSRRQLFKYIYVHIYIYLPISICLEIHMYDVSLPAHLGGETFPPS